MEAIVGKHFRPWGELERIKVLKEKGVGFVTYQNRLNAEFAKEAMADQSLDHGEVSPLCCCYNFSPPPLPPLYLYVPLEEIKK